MKNMSIRRLNFYSFPLNEGIASIPSNPSIKPIIAKTSCISTGIPHKDPTTNATSISKPINE